MLLKFISLLVEEIVYKYHMLGVSQVDESLNYHLGCRPHISLDLASRSILNNSFN